MSKISDEIRNWCEFEDGTECGGFVTKASFNKILALADRIDAEMVELPRDKDGKPIHLGDTVYTEEEPETGYEVMWFDIRSDRRQVVGIESSGANTYRPPSCLTHERPDSWERIADEIEAMTSNCGHQGFVVVSRDGVADIAARIRRLAKKGASNGTD